jgi:hypothetical protein
MREQQKAAERGIAEQYLAVRAIRGGLLLPGSEPPDFVLELGNERIGLEVTEYHDPTPTPSGHTRRVVEAEWEALREVVVAYREQHPELDDLSVILTFPMLAVPPRRDHQAFVAAVSALVTANRDRISERWTDLLVAGDQPPVLRNFLSRIAVRRARSYLEWDWNHMVAGIGTNEHELLANIRPKLGYIAPDGLTSSRLIVAGGWRHSEIVAAWTAEQLNGFHQLNAALQAGPFEELAIPLHAIIPMVASSQLASPRETTTFGWAIAAKGT